MPGANYMGGKRNAAKARGRDVTTRLQKGYFKEKKLEVLTKRLSTKSGEHLGAKDSLSRVGISFAHAQSKQKPESSDGAMSFIPSPVKFVPVAKRLTSGHGKNEAHTSRSSISDSLDNHEGMRAALKRVLNMPDLACLSSTTRRASVAPAKKHVEARLAKRKNRSSSPSPPRTKRIKKSSSPSADADPTFCDSIPVASDSCQPHGEIQSPLPPSSPPSSYWDRSNRSWALDDDDPIVSDWDDEEVTGRGLLEDPASVSQIESAAAFHCEEAPDSESPSLLQADNCSQREAFEVLPLSSVDPPPMWGMSGIPLWIDIERVHDGVYGNLFGCSDPWTMVGRVIQTDGDSESSSDDQPSLQELSLSIEAKPSLPMAPTEPPAIPEVDECIKSSETDKHLQLPQLEQVNGKYVGPSLFTEEVSDEE